MIAAHPTRASPEALRTFLDTLTTYARAFDDPAQRAGADVEFIKDKFGYPEEDVKVIVPYTAVYPDLGTHCATASRRG